MSHIYSQTVVVARKALSSIYSLRLRRYPDLRGILEKYSDSKSAAVDTADALAIYEAVRRRKPTCVLELGPGTSTEVIAAALPPSSKIVAVEESTEWLAFHEARLAPEVAKRIEFIHSPATARNGVAGYSDIPRRAYDFVHVDGPDYMGLGCTRADDILAIADGLAQSCLIMFDGRQESVRLAKPTLERLGFRMRWNPYTLNREFVRG